MNDELRRHLGLGARLRIRLARFVLFWEVLWPRVWPALGVLLIFAAMALSDLLPELPGVLHALILVVAVSAFAVLLWQGLRGLRLPSDTAARHRVETDSALKHRPLTAALDQRITNPDDPLSTAMWRAHLRRVAGSLRNLRLNPPAPRMAWRDPFALRAAAVMLGLLGIVSAAATGSWEETGNRIARAFLPSVFAADPISPAQLDLWVDPPAYTGVAPVFLARAEENAAAGTAAEPDADSVIRVPTGSRMIAQVNGGAGEPSLRLRFADRDAPGPVPFRAVEDQVHRGAAILSVTEASETDVPEDREAGDEEPHLVLPPNTPIEIVAEQSGRKLGSWRISLIDDTPPRVEFASAPARTRHEALRIDYLAEDDYGVAAVQLRVRLSEGGLDGNTLPTQIPEIWQDEELIVDLPLPSAHPTEARSTAYHDFSGHLWAGLPAELRLAARDANGQEGLSDPVAVVLPERIFNHPVARALAEQRKRLTLAPHEHQDVSDIVSDLSRRPDHFHNDVVVFMGLRVAAARLRPKEVPPDEIASVQALMWDLALRIEDGELALAMRDLREAERALREALARDASEEEISRLLDELQQALNEFVDSLMQEMQRMARDGAQPQALDDGAQQVELGELQQMLDQLRNLTQNGQREAAEQLLAELQNILENLRAGAFSQMTEQSRMAREMMDRMQELIRDQQALLEETFRRAQEMMNRPREGDLERSPSDGQRGEIPMPGQMQGEMGQTPGNQGRQMPGQQPGQQPGEQAGAGQRGEGLQGSGNFQELTLDQMAQAQKQLRSMLGDIARMMDELTGQIPSPLGQADQAMRDATGALQQGLPESATENQVQALDQLRQGLQSMMESMSGQPQAGMGQGQGQSPGQRGFGRDPLGRQLPGSYGADVRNVRVPDEAEMQRTRMILDELRRRASERERPVLERQYIDRLLRRF